MIKIVTIFLFFWSTIISQDATVKFQKFGLLTVTHSRLGDYSIIIQYLKRYTEVQCYADLIEEINIVWNNEQSPTEAGIYTRQQYWKIPVYFYRTTFNSMDHRYRLPKQSKAKVLYSLDDDIIVDCETFKKTFARYNQEKGNTIKPIVANQVRAFAYNRMKKKPEFSYQGHKNATYFTIAEPGAAFIDRHYLQIYYLLLPEVSQLRKIVRTVNNCDDIFFFALAQHFYPELLPVYNPTQASYKNTDPKIGQSKVKGVFPLRDKCVNDISGILGYNPLRFFNKLLTERSKGWQYESLQDILEMRTKGIAELKIEPAKQINDISLSKGNTTLQGQIPQAIQSGSNKQLKNNSVQTSGSIKGDNSKLSFNWIIIVLLVLTACFLLFLLVRVLSRYYFLKDSTPIADADDESQGSKAPSHAGQH